MKSFSAWSELLKKTGMLTAVSVALFLLCAMVPADGDIRISTGDRNCICHAVIQPLSGENEPDSSGGKYLVNGLPGHFVLFNTARRNEDFLRNCRPYSGIVPEIGTAIENKVIFSGIKFQLPHITFAFQHFLHKSLPPRAGPVPGHKHLLS